jgi:chaperone required for assembly of F1-ATPase
MKRFYKEVEVTASAGGFALLLDGRPVKTPGRAVLAVPGEALAQAIAGEWREQGESIDPRAMSLTGLANAAIDRIAPDPASFAASLARYGENDLLCYRAEEPGELVRRQAEAWDPFLAWARGRYDVELKVTAGILHTPQPAATVERLSKAVASRTPFELAGLSPLVTVTGSLLLALAVAEQAFTPDQAWDAASLDDRWQAEKWGEDADAVAALANRRRDFEAGARFLMLL